MKLKAFKRKNKKKTIFYIGLVGIILLLSGIFLYRTFAIYEEKNTFDVIKGQIPDQYYDTMISFYLEDENGNQTFSESMPSGENYIVNVSCDKGAVGSWDYEIWGPVIANLKESRTKCKIYFVPGRPLIDTIKSITPVTSGTGLYSVSHSDASITYTSDTTAINNLKQTELRYAGADPNNYVTFNEEEAGWRIIGLVNTPEGQRVKLVRNESIGSYSWDSSESNVNSGYGVNEWSLADLMTLLNNGSYYNRTSGTCYNGSNNQTTLCDFSSTGLTTTAKNMIDTVTWNTGSNGIAKSYSLTTSKFYNQERSNEQPKICGYSLECNDYVTRTTAWKGKIAIIYPSDYGYATSGNSTTSRSACLSTVLFSWDSSDCYNNDWLYMSGMSYKLLTPESNDIQAYRIYGKNGFGKVSSNVASTMSGWTGYSDTLPSLYLKTNVKVKSGDGSQSNPYILAV